MAQIVSITYKPAHIESRPADRFARASLPEAKLIAGQGIEGDVKGGKHPDRQLNVVSQQSFAKLAAAGFDVSPGQLGEQLVISALHLEILEPGTHLQLGDEAVIEIVKKRYPCSRFETVQGRKKALAMSRIGIMARVITGGIIRIGDAVNMIEEAAGQHV
ncbi:MAG: MOSC domain-containing protein [Chloroflexi bacterium]|nr:MAG: MOSC domain-containing protein [Chloroflexota bacterium]